MSNTVPASTYVLVVGMVVTLWSFGIVVIFTPPLYWYAIPLVLAIPEVVILARRWANRRRMHRELRATLEELG